MSPILPNPSIVRTCPEHRVGIYERERLWKRAQAGEFRIREEVTPMRNPHRDRNGKLLVANVNHFLLDDRYPKEDKRHIVLHTHSFRTDDGQIGASGKLDPKEILVGDVEYRQLEFKKPRCELCETGDMISPLKRFRDSTYRPCERWWHRAIWRIRAIIGL